MSLNFTNSFSLGTEKYLSVLMMIKTYIVFEHSKTFDNIFNVYLIHKRI